MLASYYILKMQYKYAIKEIRNSSIDRVKIRENIFGLKIKVIYISAILPKVSDSFLSSIKIAAQTTTTDVWSDFLRLQISANTKGTYASALDDFFTHHPNRTNFIKSVTAQTWDTRSSANELRVKLERCH